MIRIFSRLTAALGWLLLAGASSAPAQTLTWNDIDGITEVSQISRGGNGALFAVNLFGWIDTRYFISTDEGVSWFLSPNMAGYINTMSTNGNFLLVERWVLGVQLPDQLFFSANNGTNLTRVHADVGVTGNFTLSDSGVIFANNYSGGRTPLPLLRYGGSQWTSVGSPVGAGLIGIDHANDLFAYAGAALLVSKDYAQTWNTCLSRTLGALIFDDHNRALAGVSATIDQQGVVTQTGGVFASTDVGQTWTNLGLGDRIFYALAIDSAGNISAATDNGVFRYTAASGTWADISPVHDVFTAVQVTQSGALLASSSTSFTQTTEHPGVYRSTDNGNTWSVSGLRKRAVFSMTISPNGVLAVGTLGERLLTSTDEGASWKQAAAGALADNVYALSSDSLSLYAATDQGLYASPYGSQTWQNLSATGVTGAAYCVGVTSTGGLFIGTNFGVYASSDRGATWAASGLSSSSVQFLAVSPSDVLYAATAKDGVFASTDGGATWTSRGLVRTDLQTIEVDSFGDVLVGVYGGIFRSTDGGNTWTQSTFVNSYVYGLAVQGKQTIFAGTYSGVMVSYDGGTTWKSGGLAGQTVMSFAFTEAGNLIAGAYHSGVYETAQVITGVGERTSALPEADALLPNYPNPFNPTTRIDYLVSAAGAEAVTLRVYDILGQEVATLVNGKEQPGKHSVEWNAAGFPSGIYFCRLQTGRLVAVRKLVLTR